MGTFVKGLLKDRVIYKCTYNNATFQFLFDMFRKGKIDKNNC